MTFPSGVTIEHLDANARCMTCHQGRELTLSVNKAIAGVPDDQVMPKQGFINVHYFAAGATLYGGEVHGGYEYPGKTYAGRLKHKAPFTTCTSCHATQALEVKVNDCKACHKEVTDKASLRLIRANKVDLDGNGNAKEGVAQEIDNLRAKLLAAIQEYAKKVAGKPIVYSAPDFPYFFVDTNGSGKPDGKEAIFPNQYKNWTPRLLKAAYNYQFVTKDPGAYAHNPDYVAKLLHDSIADLGTQVSVDLKKATRP
ncbi:MAG: polyheme membrane-associated cytochrome C [Pseudolabrys sp.]